MNVIFGSAGMAKDMDWLIADLAAAGSINYAVNYFVGKDKTAGALINNTPVIDDDEFIAALKQSGVANAFIAVGSPGLRKKIYEKICAMQGKVEFPNLIHPQVICDARPGKLLIGIGNVICAGSILSTDCVMGDFVQINLDCTIGHETRIGDFTTLSPGCHIAGNVEIGKEVFMGIGAVTVEKISICDGAVIGAGAVVTKSIKEPGTYVGIPARKTGA